jgi:hypothetical protein
MAKNNLKKSKKLSKQKTTSGVKDSHDRYGD